MGSNEAAQLGEGDVGADHEQREKHHGVGDELGGDGDEEEVGLDAPLVLGAGVGEGEDEALEVGASAEAGEVVDELGGGSSVLVLKFQVPKSYGRSSHRKPKQQA